jgi:uncharacterized protein YndB with AHSA1/START domain
MPARKPSSGKRAAKKTVKATEEKFGKSARVSAQRSGQKPMAWQQSEAPKRAPYSAEEPADVLDSGHAVSVARTIDGSASAVFRAFNDPTRRAWCHERMYSVQAAVAPRMLRLAMPDKSTVTISIARKGNTRTMVSLEQTKLVDAAAADRARIAWKQALDRLAMLLDE